VSLADRFLADIREERARGIAAGTWPAHSVAVWRELADQAAERFVAGEPLSSSDDHALDLFPEALRKAAA
jgi:hypothetical protein